jgi:prevent-host-death family protein
MTVGVRELKDNLSRYVREVERGKVVTVTAHGRVVAQLVPPAAAGQERKRAPAQRLSRWDQMIAEGRVQAPVEEGDPFEGDTFETIVAPGSSAEWLDWSREDK